MRRRNSPQPGANRSQWIPSPPSDGGEGRGEEGRWVTLSSFLSPLLRRGERMKKHASVNLGEETTFRWMLIHRSFLLLPVGNVIFVPLTSVRSDRVQVVA